jgi:hypothetical protein
VTGINATADGSLLEQPDKVNKKAYPTQILKAFFEKFIA